MQSMMLAVAAAVARCVGGGGEEGMRLQWGQRDMGMGAVGVAVAGPGELGVGGCTCGWVGGWVGAPVGGWWGVGGLV